MIDTLVYSCFHELLPPEQWLKGWRGWRPEGDDTGPFQAYERTIKQSLLGVCLFVWAGMVVKVEVDQPKLLYGHNGRLIKTQVDLDRAFRWLKQALRTVCHLVGIGAAWHPGDVAVDTRTVALMPLRLSSPAMCNTPQAVRRFDEGGQTIPKGAT